MKNPFHWGSSQKSNHPMQDFHILNHFFVYRRVPTKNSSVIISIQQLEYRYNNGRRKLHDLKLYSRKETLSHLGWRYCGHKYGGPEIMVDSFSKGKTMSIIPVSAF